MSSQNASVAKAETTSVAVKKNPYRPAWLESWTWPTADYWTVPSDEDVLSQPDIYDDSLSDEQFDLQMLLVEKLAAIKSYVAAGLVVIPNYGPVFSARGTLVGCSCGKPDCHSIGKHPSEIGWQKLPARGYEELAPIWEADPRLNIGISCHGLAVIDCDGPPGLQTWDELCIRHFVPESTPIARTGSGGKHVLFRYDGPPVKNSVGTLPGIDVRTAGGQIVIYPSVHRSGNQYTWESFGDIPQISLNLLNEICTAKKPAAPIAAPCDEQIEIIQKVFPRDVEKFKQYVQVARPSTSGDRADAALMAITCQARRYGIHDSDEFLELIQPWNARCVRADGTTPYPWEPEDLERAFGNASNKVYNDALNELHGLGGGQLIERMYNEASSGVFTGGNSLINVVTRNAELIANETIPESDGIVWLQQTIANALRPQGSLDKELISRGMTRDQLSAEIEDWQATGRQLAAGAKGRVKARVERIRNGKGSFDSAVADLAKMIFDREIDQPFVDKLLREHGLKGNFEWVSRSGEELSRAVKHRLELRADRARWSADDSPQKNSTDASETISFPPGAANSVFRTYCMKTLQRVVQEDHEVSQGGWRRCVLTNQLYRGDEVLTEDKLHDLQVLICSKYRLKLIEREAHLYRGASSQAVPFHPFAEYLATLTWDGVDRLSTLSRDYLGTSNPLFDSYVRKTLLGCVGRALKPGCSMRTCLILCGPQYCGKSRFFEELAIRPEWYACSPLDLSKANKDVLIQVRSKVIYELAECDGIFTKSEATQLKQLISSPSDNFRAPYAKESADYPRGGILVGTTNSPSLLSDPSGSTRFLVISVKKTRENRVDNARLSSEKAQLWAQAHQEVLRWLEAGGSDFTAPWQLTDAEHVEQALINKGHDSPDAIKESLEDVVDELLGGKPVDWISSTHVLERLNLASGQYANSARRKLAEIMEEKGWIPDRSRNASGQRVRGYRRAESRADTDPQVKQQSTVERTWPQTRSENPDQGYLKALLAKLKNAPDAGAGGADLDFPEIQGGKA